MSDKPQLHMEVKVSTREGLQSYILYLMLYIGKDEI